LNDIHGGRRKIERLRAHNGVELAYDSRVLEKRVEPAAYLLAVLFHGAARLLYPTNSSASRSISNPSCHCPSLPRSKRRMTPTGLKPTFS